MYPSSRNETIADGIVHALSISLSLYGAFWLWCYLPMWRTTEMSWAVGVYIVIMVSAFTVSGVYHMTPVSDLRVRLRRADHGLIYLRIASSYTPLVLAINTPFPYVVLAGVWIAALIGFFSRVVFWKGEGGSSLALYFALSCAMFLLIWPMWQRLDHTSIWLLLGGGATYGIGAIFYSRKSMPYRYPIWHIFVTTASAAFVVAIAIAIR